MQCKYAHSFNKMNFSGTGSISRRLPLLGAPEINWGGKRFQHPAYAWLPVRFI